jgi:hypothetical protein
MKYTKEYLKENDTCILCETKEEAKKIASIFGKHISLVKRWNSRENCFGYYRLKKDFDFIAKEFKYIKHVLLFSEVIADYEASKPKRKLKGFAVPFSLFKLTDGSESYWVNKGDVYIKFPEFGQNGYILERYNSDKYSKDAKCVFYLPSEIVEQWEPVYEEEKPTFGSFSDIIRHFEGCKVVAQAGDYILVSNAFNIEALPHIHHHLSLETGWNFTESFQSELQELGIKI